MIKKSGFFLCLLCFILCISNIIYAAEINRYPEKIELTTDIQNASTSFNDEQGESIIGLSAVTPGDVLKMTFQANKPEVKSYMIKNLVIKYKVNIGSLPGWEEWSNLAQSKEIDFANYLESDNPESSDVSIKIKFIVPQSIKIRKGSYPGKISLELLE